MLTRWREWRERRRVRQEQQKRAHAIRTIRQSLAFFGMPIEDMTDDEIEAGCVQMSRLSAQCGITVEEATAGFNALGRAFRFRSGDSTR